MNFQKSLFYYTAAIHNASLIILNYLQGCISRNQGVAKQLKNAHVYFEHQNDPVAVVKHATSKLPTSLQMSRSTCIFTS